MLTLSVLIIKFWQLILSQMFILNNRSILSMNCLILDMIIQVCLTFNDYLYGCVSIERVITVHKGIAKWISLCIFILIILTHVHDPIHRHLIDDIDIDEQRIWCVVQYSSSTNIFNSFITRHDPNPNSNSNPRSRLTIQPRLTFKKYLQLKQHKSHLIALCTLVFLALPRLIISFIRGCMKSPYHSWFFLSSCLFAFLPSMIIFIIFLLPSKMYKKEFNTVLDQTVRKLRTTYRQ
ncbi:unnamed protein product [Adineta steineri]|uniref:Uncharacterized protein n=1 Tax=Adineta steineri TaxID=433720 RepID=A0A815QU19_9BILA|nr:unnamed protein product [Adineta steineri]CAF1466600.1 unnamed protein product [Adineta steineri]CAF1634584.1 unnamed protein product [Adineta steineri]CAF1634612.1 unnamed protein product [Adineta steineri]